MNEQVVIIPVHNQLPLLKKCVASLAKFSPEAKIIIVDDGSTDKDTHDWIKKGGNFVRLHNETAQGFSAACNKGIDYAMANYDFICLCLLNSDTEIVTDNWFGKVSYHYTVHEKIGISGVMSDNALAQTVQNPFHYMKIIDSKPTIYSTIIHGFCFFIGRELIMTIGRLDNEKFPHYGSEDDYCLLAIKHGFENILVGSVFVHHHNEASYGKEVRANFIKHTVPELHRRWGVGYCNNAGMYATKAARYINKK